MIEPEDLKTQTRETIYALASGGGRAAVAIIRLSGPSAGAILRSMVVREVEPRVATLTTIRHPEIGYSIDRGLVLWFPAPWSFTGEDCLEFQVHGSKAVIGSILRVLGEIGGARLAEPGEFARRALENGKLDLIGVEALADLINAETEEQRKLASVQGSGALRQLSEQLRDKIIELMATIEIELDFSDEEGRPDNIREVVAAGLKALSSQLAKVGGNYRCVERLREGMTVLIAGPPNAGKSSLLNALAQRDVAIVSEYAGTTRDVLEVRLDLSGFPVNLIDTAGIRSSNNPIEMEGIRRAIAKSAAADLVLWLSPPGEPVAAPPGSLMARPLWFLKTKADLANSPSSQNQPVVLDVSALTGHNLDVLVERLKDFAKEHMTFNAPVFVANERQYCSVSSALKAVEAASREGLALEIVSEELRAACFALESLLGKVDVEIILDKLFSRFCIGK